MDTHSVSTPNVDTDHGQARHTDPPTARAAAMSIRPGSARHQLLVIHREHPEGLTDEEAATLAGIDLGSEYATRCSELMRLGLLVDTDITRPGASGLARLVRRVTTQGYSWVEGDATPKPKRKQRLPVHTCGYTQVGSLWVCVQDWHAKGEALETGCGDIWARPGGTSDVQG